MKTIEERIADIRDRIHNKLDVELTNMVLSNLGNNLYMAALLQRAYMKGWNDATVNWDGW